MEGAPNSGPQVGRARLVVFYAVVALIAAAAVAFVIAQGEDQEAQRSVAGAYEVAPANPCLGENLNISQSGEFVTLGNPADTLGGAVRVDDGRLTGEVSCVSGGEQKLDATIRDGVLSGTVGGEHVEASFKQEPPDPGLKQLRAPDGIAGDYELAPRSACLGGKLELEEKGSKLELIGKSQPESHGELTYDDGKVAGTATCGDEREAEVAGTALGRKLQLTVTPSKPAAPEKVVAQEAREFPKTAAAFFIAIAVVMLVARAFGAVAVRLRQPRVMGEVTAGITLGPTVLGALAPDVSTLLFPVDIIPFIGIVANLGLIFYMFLVGLEIDLGQLKGRVSQAIAISNTSVVLPMILGLLVALPIYPLVGPDKPFVAFALFMGVSMSITAFPVLARILVERRMLKRPLGALALACAAIDDVTAWFLIALATAVAVAGGIGEVGVTILLAALFVAVMAFGVRPLLARVSTAYDESGQLSGAWIAAIFAGILLSAYTTEEIGIALIFGAFAMGAIMPRHAGLTEHVTGRIEDYVVILLLPLFFAYTGLKTDIGLLGDGTLIVITLVLIAIAIVGKFGGTMIAARVMKMGWRESSMLGTLINTRGLTELIVLNLALEKGVISEALFAALVIMALVTTFMAGPILNLLDPDEEYGAPVEEEAEEARQAALADSPVPVPEQSILVASANEQELARLCRLTEPLATSEPPRELILTRLVRPTRGSAVRGGLQTDSRLLREANAAVQEERRELLARGVAARAIALTSVDPGEDLARLAQLGEVDLILMDGQRPLVGGAIPRGDVRSVLEQAPGDVGVLVAKEEEPIALGAETGVLVPFGGGEHDWAALELAAWLASTHAAPLKLLGAAGQTEEGAADDESSDPTRMLASASLLVQQFAGIATEPLVAERGREGIVEAAAGAGLLVIGLSDRWRAEGLGEFRAGIARAAPVPILFVRRGTRPGALAPRDDVTKFGWSLPGAGGDLDSLQR